MAKGGAKKAAAAAARAAANRMLADNRQARHQYEILETLETGIELVGTEVKSIRNGKANLRDVVVGCVVPDAANGASAYGILHGRHV